MFQFNVFRNTDKVNKYSLNFTFALPTVTACMHTYTCLGPVQGGAAESRQHASSLQRSTDFRSELVTLQTRLRAELTAGRAGHVPVLLLCSNMDPKDGLHRAGLFSFTGYSPIDLEIF